MGTVFQTLSFSVIMARIMCLISSVTALHGLKYPGMRATSIDTFLSLCCGLQKGHEGCERVSSAGSSLIKVFRGIGLGIKMFASLCCGLSKDLTFLIKNHLSTGAVEARVVFWLVGCRTGRNFEPCF